MEPTQGCVIWEETTENGKLTADEENQEGRRKKDEGKNRWQIVEIHSARNAIIGSTRLARRAGIQQARRAVVRSVKAMKMKVIGSEALTP